MPEWELLDCAAPADHGLPLRLLAISLRKKAWGLRLWWKCAFKGDPELDRSALVDRSQQQEAQSQAFLSAFKTAQEQFKARVRHQTPMEIDVGPADDRAEGPAVAELTATGDPKSS